jgi:hypothetical protein
MKIRKTAYWIVGIVVLLGWTDLVLAQTYTVGDVVDNFGTTICENGEGDWNYNTDGLGKVTWLNIFTSW